MSSRQSSSNLRKRKSATNSSSSKKPKLPTDNKTKDNAQEELTNIPSTSTSSATTVEQSENGEMYEVTRTALNKSTDKIVDLEESEICLQTAFNVKKYVGRRILCLDIGSSFIKGTEFVVPEKITANNRTVIEDTVNFPGVNQFLPSLTYFNHRNREIIVGKMTDDQKNEGDWEELENLKKIFMVSELEEIRLKDNETIERVSYLVFMMVKNIFDQLVTTHNEDDIPTTDVAALMITCPTATSDFTKRIFRNCILKAFNQVFKTQMIELEDVFVIEEYVLLKYFANSKSKATMYVDLGHLTMDVVVVETVNGRDVVTFKNGEAGGMSILHQVLKKHNLNPNTEMEKLFKYYTLKETLPNSLQQIEEDINEAIRRIIKPLSLMILQKQVTNVHFSGAITKVKYFSKKFKEWLSFERLTECKKNMEKFLKDEYLHADVPKCCVHHEMTGISALVKGASKIINSSMKSIVERNGGNIPIILEEQLDEHSSLPLNSSNYIENYVPGILYQEQDKKGISILDISYKMHVKQDAEIFLMKFSPLIDIVKIDNVTLDNLDNVGILEFVRFTKLNIWFDPNEITTTMVNFLVFLELSQDYLFVRFYYSKTKTYHVNILKIERKGRNERIPINDADEIIFKTNEDDSNTWYGVLYETDYIINRATSQQAIPLKDLKKTKELLGRDYYKKIKITYRPEGYEPQITEITPGDLKELSEKTYNCANCRVVVQKDKCKNNTSARTLKNYRTHLNKSISFGYICAKCYRKFLDKKNEAKKGLPDTCYDYDYEDDEDDEEDEDM